MKRETDTEDQADAVQAPITAAEVQEDEADSPATPAAPAADDEPQPNQDHKDEDHKDEDHKDEDQPEAEAEEAEEVLTEPPAVLPAQAGPDPADAARRRLIRALGLRASRSQLLVALVCALLGFAVVVQTHQAQVQSLASLRESDLIAVLDNVTQESARLDDQARALQQTFDGLRTSSDRAPAARAAAQERLEVLGVLAGTLPATGPGVEIDIPDPKLVVNSTELLETVQELRDAGAEVMQIGPVRVIASTALVDAETGMLIDQTVVTPPYKILAIGDPQTLAAALEIPGGVLEVLRGKGVVGSVHPHDTITITSLRSPRAPQYARSAASAP